MVGRHIQTGIKVQANHNTESGTINWVPESHGKLLWQIGIPDRRPTEFHVPPGQPAPIPLKGMVLNLFNQFFNYLTIINNYQNSVSLEPGCHIPKHFQMMLTSQLARVTL